METRDTDHEKQQTYESFLDLEKKDMGSRDLAKRQVYRSSLDLEGEDGIVVRSWRELVYYVSVYLY